MGTKIDFGCLYFITPDGEEVPWEGIDEVSLEPDPESQFYADNDVWLSIKNGLSFEFTAWHLSNNWLKLHGYAMMKKKPARKRRTRSKKRSNNKGVTV